MRPIDDVFLIEESFYVAINPGEVSRFHLDSQVVPLNEVRFPDCSINRSKYSEPTDLLVAGRENWAIGNFQGKSIPTPLEQEPNFFEFLVFDDPAEEFNNPAHSEIRTYKNNERCFQKSQVSKIVRTKFRAKLWSKMLLIPSAL
jgi:hypothetical protein